MYAGKPIIGLAGGIGSGKSLVAAMLAKLNCLVISSDDLVHQAYQLPHVRQTLRQWWGKDVLDAAGAVNRRAIAQKVFASDQERARLEHLIHPIVAQQRRKIMEAHKDNPAVAAFVWDVPLLFETGLHRQCDAVIFVESPDDLRDSRLSQSRGWAAGERLRREKLQMPLDRKRELSDYIVRNAGEADQLSDQVQNVLRSILA